MKFDWNDELAQKATKIISTSKWQGKNIVIDSRKIKKNDIFLALLGQNLDGHDFVGDALERGASVAIVERNLPYSSLLIVDNTRKTLEDFANYHRAQYKNKVIAVTGSSGKTTTKEQLRFCFGALDNTYASEGNYNNELGLPLSVANLDLETNYAIFEMGMNHSGEIALLTQIAKPDIAIITNITAAHIEFFSSLKEIADAKGEIFQGIAKNGAAIINIDCDFGNYLINLAQKSNIKNIITYGSSKEADCRLISYKEIENNAYIKASIFGKEIDYQMSVNGIYFAINSLSCLGAVYASNHNLEEVKISANALINFKALKGRGQYHIIETSNNKKFTLIDHSYNANPNSIISSINAIGKSYLRKVAILGDMKELGERAKSQHIALKEHIIINNMLLVAIGPMMKYLYDSLDKKYKLAYYENAEQAKIDIDYYIKNEDLVLIKGSNSMEMYKIVDQMLKNQNHKF